MAGTITIKYCDIEKIPTECIVNAANDGLHYGTGVCHAVFTGAGMAAMTEACNAILQEHRAAFEKLAKQ